MTLKISTWSYYVYAKNKLIILEFKQATTKAEVAIILLKMKLVCLVCVKKDWRLFFNSQNFLSLIFLWKKLYWYFQWLHAPV